MDDKEIKNDLPGPVSHFSTQARCFPSSSPPYSHTLICSLPPLPSSLSPSLSLLSRSVSSHPLTPLLPIFLLLHRHVMTPHDYWRNHSCNSLPSFPWGLQYLSLSLPQVLRHCLGNCMCKARDACDPLRQGSQRCEGAHHTKKQQFDVSYYVSQQEP